MLRTIKHLLLLAVLLLTATACTDNDITDNGSATIKENDDKVKLAVVLPFSDSGTDWNRVLTWAKENIRAANDHVEPEYEIYDENTVDIDALAAQLAKRSDIDAVIGCQYSAHTMTLARHCAATYKPVFTFATAEQLQRTYGQRGFLWCLAENDITQCELLLVRAQSFYMAERVALICSDDVYGQTFYDWFAFQAEELGLEAVDAIKVKTADEALQAYKQIATENTDAIVCALSDLDAICSVQDAVWNEEEPWGGNIIFADGAYTPRLIEKGGEAANWTEGMALVADPATGFNVSYNVKYGSAPGAGEAHLYDAIMTACYAHRYAQLHDMDDLNDAIARLLNNTAEEKGMWTTRAMKNVFSQIEKGATPAFSGASGNLDFSTDHYTAVQYSSYAHWRVYYGTFYDLDYTARSRNSSLYASWEWKAQHMQQFDPDDTSSTASTYPTKQGNWAVVVAASKTWTNYRHQSDALAFYQLLKHHGYDDDHIILIMADDLAHDSSNPEPGVVRHEEDGPNLYTDVHVDYRLDDLTPADMQRILLGTYGADGHGGLPSGAADNVVLFWSGHGEKGKMMWGADGDAFTKERIHETVSEMHEKGKYRKLLGLIETCYSGTIGEAVAGTPGVLFMTAANGKETSKADTYSLNLNTWMTNRFTSSLLSSLEGNPAITLRQLYYNVFSSTLGSHVCLWGASSYGSVYANTMGEFL